jgi:hypothetical protein
MPFYEIATTTLLQCHLAPVLGLKAMVKEGLVLV